MRDRILINISERNKEDMPYIVALFNLYSSVIQ